MPPNMVWALFQAHQQAQRAKVGAQVEEVLGGDLPDHDALLHTALGEGLAQFVQLPHPHPFDLVDQFGELGVGLIFEGGGDQTFHPHVAGLLRQLERQGTISCNDAEGFDVR